MATTRVQLPDGNIGEFPASMSHEQIEAVLAKQFPPESAPPGVPKAPIPAGLTGAPEKHDIWHGNTPIHQEIDQAAQSEPITGAGSVARNLGAGTTRVTMSPFAHPIETAKSMGSMFAAGMQGPQGIADIAPQMGEPFVGKPGGETVANIPSAIMALVGGNKATSIEPPETGLVQKMTNPIPRSYRSLAIPMEEAQARTMTDALGVNPRAYRSTMQTLTQHGPVIKDYIQRNNFGTKPLEFSKAATGAGQEATGHFQQNFIQPNEMAETAEGPLGNVYRRVTQINKELNPAHRNQLTLQTDAQLARNAELEAERDRLNNAMYETLSYRSGMPVEDIRALNQRGAGLQSVGDEADAAQQLRRLGYGAYNAQGQPLPLGPLDKALKLLKVLRGGEEAVAGRKIGRVFNGMSAEPTPLPDANRINMFRHAAENEELGQAKNLMAKQEANLQAAKARKPQGMGPTQPPEAEVELPPDNYLSDFQNRLRARAGKNRANAIPAPEAPTPQSPLDRFMGRARETQEQARALRRQQ